MRHYTFARLYSADARWRDDSDYVAFAAQRAAAAGDGKAGEEATEDARVVEIPVNYGAEYGLDQAEAAAIAGLAGPAEVVERHAAGDYRDCGHMNQNPQSRVVVAAK